VPVPEASLLITNVSQSNNVTTLISIQIWRTKTITPDTHKQTTATMGIDYTVVMHFGAKIVTQSFPITRCSYNLWAGSCQHFPSFTMLLNDDDYVVPIEKITRHVTVCCAFSDEPHAYCQECGPSTPVEYMVVMILDEGIEMDNARDIGLKSRLISSSKADQITAIFDSIANAIACCSKEDCISEHHDTEASKDPIDVDTAVSTLREEAEMYVDSMRLDDFFDCMDDISAITLRLSSDKRCKFYLNESTDAGKDEVYVSFFQKRADVYDGDDIEFIPTAQDVKDLDQLLTALTTRFNCKVVKKGVMCAIWVSY
jgi:hypothetical protein